jgi:hypothetical protein
MRSSALPVRAAHSKQAARAERGACLGTSGAEPRSLRWVHGLLALLREVGERFIAGQRRASRRVHEGRLAGGVAQPERRRRLREEEGVALELEENMRGRGGERDRDEQSVCPAHRPKAV